ncbi:MAG TPA: hypothetical protein VKU41_20595 [Polyangiaceae bacterium]|nr:hypothetical protein [Polyangiaceae bacterium]
MTLGFGRVLQTGIAVCALAACSACSSAPDTSGTNTPASTGAVEGGSGDEGGSMTSGGSGSGSGSASGGATSGAADAAVSCDGSLPVGDAGGACTQCKTKMCAKELAQCQADCSCNPIEACLEQMDEVLNACPNAVNAIMGGSQTLTTLIDCLDTNCLAPCFPNDVSDAAASGG